VLYQASLETTKTITQEYFTTTSSGFGPAY